MSSPVHFFYEDIKFRIKSAKVTKSWIENAVKSEGKEIAEINYIFCSDAVLVPLNIQYLNHDTLTDIITFDVSEDPRTLEGEIYISIDRVKENATAFNVPFDKEIHRVIIHGVLHMLGYTDKTAREKQRMREKEDAYLSLMRI